MNKIPKCVQPSGKRFESFLGGGGGGGQSNNKNLDQVKEKLKQKIPNYKKTMIRKGGFFSMLRSLLKFHN